MNFKIRSPILLILVILAISTYSCWEEKEPQLEDTIWLITLSPEDIDSTGITFVGKFDNGSKAISEMGFYWSDKNIDDPSEVSKVIAEDILESNTFKLRFSFQLKKGIRYFVRAYVKSGQDIVVAPQVDFISQGSTDPELISFEPKSGLPGQIMLIKGKGFSINPEDIRVVFNSESYEPKSSNDTIISIQVPQIFDKRWLKIEVLNNAKMIKFTEQFEITIPYVDSVSMPTHVSFADTIHISGRFLDRGEVVVEAFRNLTILEQDSSTISCILPWGYNSFQSSTSMSVSFLNDRYSKSKYTLPNVATLVRQIPGILEIHPPILEADTGIVTLIGKGFSPLNDNNTVQIGSNTRTIVYATYDTLKIDLGGSLIDDYANDQYIETTVSVNTGGLSSISNPVLIIDYKRSWIRLNDFPSNTREGMLSFEIDGRYFVGMGSVTLGDDATAIYEYFPNTDHWEIITNHPDGSFNNMSVVNGDEVFFGLGSFWKFKPISNTWTQLTPAPVNEYGYSKAFTIGDDIYIMGRTRRAIDEETGQVIIVNNVFYSYNISNDSWDDLGTFPIFDTGGQIVAVTKVDETAYLIMGTTGYNPTIVEYDPLSEAWREVGPANVTNTRYILESNKGGQYLYGNESSSSILYYFDESILNYTRLTPIEDFEYLFFGFALIIDDYAYLGHGRPAFRNPREPQVWKLPIK